MEKQEESGKWVMELFGKMSNLQRFIQKYEKQFKKLSEREIEILTLVAEGMKNSAIAGRLEISRATVQNHRAGIRKKIPIKSQADYIKYALAFGLISF